MRAYYSSRVLYNAPCRLMDAIKSKLQFCMLAVCFIRGNISYVGFSHFFVHPKNTPFL